MSGPLSGIRIVDATHVLAGPFCSYQLGLMGADVIRVERVDGGDFIRNSGPDAELNEAGLGVGFLSQNANKRSITLDLKSPQGREIFSSLVATADVLVENFRPGVMERLGFGVEAMRAINKKLIYCSITGFGQVGPLSGAPVYDHVMQAMAGMMAINGAEGPPRRVGMPVIDYVTGLLASQAVCAALAERAAGGPPRTLDVSMLEASFMTMGSYVSEHLVTGTVRKPSSTVALSGSPFSGIFDTAQGQLSVTANNAAQVGRLCRALQREDWLSDPRLDNWSAHPELSADRPGLDAAYATKTALEWEAELNAAGVPAGKLRSLSEMLDHPQTDALGAVLDAGTPKGLDRNVRVPGLGFRIDGKNPSISRPPPRLGEHTDEVLQELGVSADAVVALREKGVV